MRFRRESVRKSKQRQWEVGNFIRFKTIKHVSHNGSTHTAHLEKKSLLLNPRITYVSYFSLNPSTDTCVQAFPCDSNHREGHQDAGDVQLETCGHVCLRAKCQTKPLEKSSSPNPRKKGQWHRKWIRGPDTIVSQWWEFSRISRARPDNKE